MLLYNKYEVIKVILIKKSSLSYAIQCYLKFIKKDHIVQEETELFLHSVSRLQKKDHVPEPYPSIQLTVTQSIKFNRSFRRLCTVFNPSLCFIFDWFLLFVYILPLRQTTISWFDKEKTRDMTLGQPCLKGCHLLLKMKSITSWSTLRIPDGCC